MRRPSVTDHQLLLLMEMCFDAEERCDQRIARARDDGDFRAAADAVQLKEHYEELKHRLFTEMKSDATTTADVHAQLQGFGKYFGQGASQQL